MHELSSICTKLPNPAREIIEFEVPAIPEPVYYNIALYSLELDSGSVGWSVMELGAFSKSVSAECTDPFAPAGYFFWDQPPVLCLLESVSEIVLRMVETRGPSVAAEAHNAESGNEQTTKVWASAWKPLTTTNS